MPDPAALIELSPDMDVAAAAETFARTGRTQIAPFLTDESVRRVRGLLEHETPWGLVWSAAGSRPEVIRAESIQSVTPDRARVIHDALGTAMAAGEYAYCYSTYPLVQALL